MPTSNIEYIHPLHSQLIVLVINKIRQQQYMYALQLIKKALYIFPNDADTYYLYSVCLYWTGNQQQSKKAQKLAIQMNPICQIYELPDKQACQKLIPLYCRAAVHEKKIKKQTNLTVQSWYNYTILFHEKTNYQRVQQIYERLFEKYPQVIQTKSHAFLGNYANTLYDLGRYQQAIDKYQIQISRDRDQTRYFSNCAMLYTVVGQYDKAQNYIIEALTNNPRKALYIYNYANILAKTNRLQQSINKIREAISIQANDPYYGFKLALNLTILEFNMNHQKFNTVILTQIQNKLNSSLLVFQKCISNHSPNSANANKRILSMKNVIYLKNYAQCFKQCCMEFLSKNLIFQEFQILLDLLGDFLLHGQTKKIQINQKILSIFMESKQKIKSLFSLSSISQNLPEILKKYSVQKLLKTSSTKEFNEQNKSNLPQQGSINEAKKQIQKLEIEKEDLEQLKFNNAFTQLSKLWKNTKTDDQINLISYIWKWEIKLRQLSIRKPIQHIKKWPQIDFAGLFD